MGNPLAVVTDARGLTDDEMQKLARETNLSETTFIVPPRAPEVEAREEDRVRIFTIEEELPFAGHPTLGTALYLHSTLARQADHVVLHLNIGKVPVRFAPDTRCHSIGCSGEHRRTILLFYLFRRMSENG